MTDTKKIIVKHFNELSDTYDSKSLNRKKYLDSIDRIIKAKMKAHGAKNPLILDVACGTGLRSRKIEASIKGATVYGSDVSPKMIANARKYLKKTFIQDMAKLDFPSHKFDAVICLFNSFGYLENRRERVKALSEFNRVLKPNGILFIDVMNFWHFGEGIKFKRTFATALRELVTSALNPWMGLKNKKFFLDIAGRKIEGFVHGFTQMEMKRLLKAADFSIQEFSVIGYDSGKTRSKATQGQLFYMCRPGK